jgi:hypothetical protein
VLEKEMRSLAKICRQEILKLVDAPLPLLSDSTREELKRSARITLLLDEALYRPGGAIRSFQSQRPRINWNALGVNARCPISGANGTTKARGEVFCFAP